MAFSRERTTESHAKDLVRRMLRLGYGRKPLTALYARWNLALRIGLDGGRQMVLSARTVLESEAMNVRNSNL